MASAVAPFVEHFYPVLHLGDHPHFCSLGYPRAAFLCCLGCCPSVFQLLGGVGVGGVEGVAGLLDLVGAAV